MELFSNQEVNTGRQTSIDAAKVASIVIMVVVHTFIYVFGEESLVEGYRYAVNIVFGGPLGAPVFMICMGMGIAYSRRNDPRTMADRGIRLFIVAYLLNIVRAIPPAILAFAGHDQEYLDSAMVELMGIDIFQFAGLAMMAMALLRHWKANNLVIVLTGVALSVLGSFLRFVDMGNFTLNLIFSPFLGIHVGNIFSYFPFVNWFVFVTVGYVLGQLLRRCTDTKKLFNIVAPIATAIFVGYMIYAIPRRAGIFSNDDQYFYYLTTFDVFICLMATLAQLGIGHLVMRLVSPAIQQKVALVANELNRIYLIHWIIITWIVSLLLVETFNLNFNDFTTTLMALVILCVSIWLGRKKPFNMIKL